ncbi:AraD1 family protein [Paracoccus sulfuroxidans]|uniref:Fumarylacetoacetase-like C-terminal domain-containing protein n=1 Tax=Paracoccus sulfuroxidans TaxID=384678 RepID=A0A562NGR2_9RHOB|nr:AraD1 family protein [Paracoccus sulfuroxidans]TWI31278.1 hypothetical protein IQ24_03136 [Paracoccus sulfuroxidans]
MLISQISTPSGGIEVLARNEGEPARQLLGFESTHALALAAIAAGKPLSAMIAEVSFGAEYDPEALEAEGRYLPPITHPDPCHLHLTGTGLTHTGSAATRDNMHAKAGDEAQLTDSMRMFRMGLEGGKPAPGQVGVQPEWFYKGNGHALVAPGAPLRAPSFSQDLGEEPEIAGIYVIGPNGRPYRLGYAVANEFSDHVTERHNYLWLAHSKLRPASLGPEIRLGALPQDVRGTSRVLRDGAVIWEKPFFSGEENMSHSIANLEHHHFKYGLFRQPGDVHVHMFGTATLSFADGIEVKQSDVFEISAEGFGQKLRNPTVYGVEDELALSAVSQL